MRPLLGPLLRLLVLLPLLLAGCGSHDDEPTADDPAPTSQTSTPQAPESQEQALDYDAVLVNTTGGGGTETDVLTPVGDPAAAKKFVKQFRVPDFADMVGDAIADARQEEGADVYAAVVEVSCDVPTGVEVTESDDGLTVTARSVPDPAPECYAPVVTVAVVSVRA